MFYNHIAQVSNVLNSPYCFRTNERLWYDDDDAMW